MNKKQSDLENYADKAYPRNYDTQYLAELMNASDISDLYDMASKEKYYLPSESVLTEFAAIVKNYALQYFPEIVGNLPNINWISVASDIIYFAQLEKLENEKDIDI